ncbi:WecB/TagA/CpsF family glycosyltransferase [Desulfobulbus elongatus]|uniref:WecB/TagA/CpsF family glycosyltransferase n=1 Tax=Desulfobulbus elongatus TaxID=53332 RepID=UPI0006856F7D|nr:WecB/TagA/CpsF family glycosyltransferase [Desulfobulbus elongatus]
MNDRLPILDIWVDPVSREEALHRVRGFLAHGDRPHAIFAANPEKNFSVPTDATLYQCYREADLLLPDGIGVVLAARLLHGVRLQRLPGSEFIFDICRLAEAEGHAIFVYGAREEVNGRSVALLLERYPGLRIAGRANGYVSPEEMPWLIERINNSQAAILFLALGSPRQEKWFAAHKGALSTVRVVQGIGGTLDTIGGNVQRAPEFWCRHNLEWLYRLVKEPKRIKRQKVLPLFALLVLKQWLSMRIARVMGGSRGAGCDRS